MPVSESKNPGMTRNDTSKTDGHGDQLFPAGHLVPFVLVTALFFLWAIPNNLNDVLIRQFMKSFTISRTQAGFVQFAFYMGYFFLAMPAALIMLQSRLQSRIRNRPVAFRNRLLPVLAGRAGRTLLIFPLRLLRDRKRLVVP